MCPVTSSPKSTISVTPHPWRHVLVVLPTIFLHVRLTKSCVSHRSHLNRALDLLGPPLGIPITKPQRFAHPHRQVLAPRMSPSPTPTDGLLPRILHCRCQSTSANPGPHPQPRWAHNFFRGKWLVFSIHTIYYQFINLKIRYFNIQNHNHNILNYDCNIEKTLNYYR
jgi:hypothetical protein